MLADSDREKRKKLGDKNLEIAILIKPRTSQHKNTHLHKPSHQLEVAHSYPFRPIEDTIHQQYYSQAADNFGSPDFGGNPKNRPRLEKSSRNFRNSEQQENMQPNAMIESPFGKPNKEQHFGSGVSSFIESSGDKKTDNNKKASHLRLLDTLQTIFSTTPAKESKKKDQKESIRVKIEVTKNRRYLGRFILFRRDLLEMILTWILYGQGLLPRASRTESVLMLY